LIPAGRRRAAIGLVLVAGLAAAQTRSDAPVQPTGPALIDAMLHLAAVTPQDVVYDLGCGDGRLVIAAARKFGARGVGIDIDAGRVGAANWNAQRANVSERVRFVQADPGAADLRDATVIVVSRSLGPTAQPLAGLKPGTRIVSGAAGVGADWPSERTVQIGDRTIRLWRVPARLK
jgi:SAM-dependent methyltransferase